MISKKIRLLPSPCLSVRLSAYNNSRTAQQIDIKYDIGHFY